SVHAVAFSADGLQIATGHVRAFDLGGGPQPRTDFICVWNAVTGRELRRFLPNDNDVTGLAYSPNGLLLVSCGTEGKVLLWEVASSQVRRKFEGHTNWVSGLDFAPDGRHIASASSDGTAIVWRVFAPPGAMSLDAAWNDLAASGEKAHVA